MKKPLLFVSHAFLMASLSAQNVIIIEAPSSTPQYGIADYIFKIQGISITNPFTDTGIKWTFVPGNTSLSLERFTDSQDGSLYRLRFSPEIATITYSYKQLIFILHEERIIKYWFRITCYPIVLFLELSGIKL